MQDLIEITNDLLDFDEEDTERFDRILKRPTLRQESVTFTKKNEWTKKEDQKLLEATEVYTGNWQKISEAVNTNKDASECFARVHKFNNGAKIGKWSEELDAKVY